MKDAWKALGGLAVFGLMVGLTIGWLMNIFALVVWHGYMGTGELIVRIAGIFFVPLGGIMGYI